jgi:hypothetical protein
MGRLYYLFFEGAYFMSEAIEVIASHYIRLKDRVALERMRDHRNNLLQNYRIHAAQGFRVESLEMALQKDIAALDDALSRLST